MNTLNLENKIPTHITDFSQIKDMYMEIHNKITPEKIKAKIKVISNEEIKKRTGDRPAVLYRNIFTADKIYIREMPIHEMLYELSHEVGHSLKPHLDEILDAEETKAIVYQYLFSNKMLHSDFEFKTDYLLFELYRRENIASNDMKYDKYHSAAQTIVNLSGYDWKNATKTIRYITKQVTH